MFRWFKRHKLPYKPIIGLDGVFTEKAGPLAGMRAHSAREKMVQLLEEEGSFKKFEANHPYGKCT